MTGFTACPGLLRSRIAHKCEGYNTGGQRLKNAHASGGRTRSEKAGALGALPTRRDPHRGTNVPGPGVASSASLQMPIITET